MAAVKSNGIALQFVKEQTPEICLAAVEQNGRALSCVKEQSPEICLAAVEQNGLALEYVKEQSLEICLEAMKQNRKAVECINVELISDVQFVQNVSRSLDIICEHTGKDVHTTECGNVLLVCEDGADTPIAKLDANGNLECYVNGFGDLGNGLEPNLDHDAKAVGDGTENHDDL